VLSFTDGMHWGLRIEKPTYSPTGRKRKSVPIILLVANPDQTVPDLLREVARLWEHGEYETGTPILIDDPEKEDRIKNGVHDGERIRG